MGRGGGLENYFYQLVSLSEDPKQATFESLRSEDWKRRVKQPLEAEIVPALKDLVSESKN